MAPLHASLLALGSLALGACHPPDPCASAGGAFCVQDPDDPCPSTLDAFCASGMEPCPLTWEDAHDRFNWHCGVITLSTCDDVMIASHHGVDTGLRYLYEPGSGALYRIEGVGIRGERCAAGAGPERTCDDPHPVELDNCFP